MPRPALTLTGLLADLAMGQVADRRRGAGANGMWTGFTCG